MITRGLARSARARPRPQANIYAELVDEQHDPNVRIMTMEDLDREHNYAADDPQGDPHYHSSRVERLQPDTVRGKSAGSQTLVLPQILSDMITDATKNYSPNRLRQSASRYYRSLAESEAHRPATETLDVLTHLTGIFVQNYASLHNVVSEVIRRKGDNWKPKKVLDVGFGPATGMLALNELMPETWKPERKVAVVIGHANMKKYASAMLAIREPAGENDTNQRTVLRSHIPPYGSPSKYDLIIATHQLYRSGFHYPVSVDEHTSHLVSLLNPGGVLVLVERGDPTGFETIARARQIVLRPETTPDDVTRTFKEFKGSEMRVLAPCSHHGKCPLQVGLEKRNSGKDPAFFHWCKFGQVVQRPPFLAELKRGKVLAQKWTHQTEDGSFRGTGGRSLSGGGRPFGRSTETANHSYLVLEKRSLNAEEDQEVPAWPRILRNPMKRDKHVIMETCAPSGNVEHWTVTPSFDRAAYHDARKASGGDLWGLGAKTIQVRGGNQSKLGKLHTNKKSALSSKNDAEPEESKEASAAVDAAWQGKAARTQQVDSDEGVFSDAHFEELAKVFDQKRYRDDEKRWAKAKYYEKKGPHAKW